jgi:hypothetical protein
MIATAGIHVIRKIPSVMITTAGIHVVRKNLSNFNVDKGSAELIVMEVGKFRPVSCVPLSISGIRHAFYTV